MQKMKIVKQGKRIATEASEVTALADEAKAEKIIETSIKSVVAKVSLVVELVIKTV
jgi:hypothetical protein